MDQLEIEEIRDIESFCNMREEWDSLLQKSSDNNVFLTWEWLFTWWQHLGENKQLRIFLIKKNKTIIGIAPLMEWQYKKGIFKMNILENICGEECDYSGIILTERKNEAVSILLNNIKELTSDGKTIVRFWHIPETSESFTTLLNEYNNHGNSLKFTADVSSISSYITLPSNWDDFFKTLGKKTRKSMRRSRNRIHRTFQVELKKYSGQNDLYNILEVLYKLHRKRWQRKSAGSKFSDSRYCDFFRDASSVFYDKGWLDLSYLELDGKIVSVEWGLNYNNIYWDMTTTFDEEYSHYGVGNIHSMYLIDAAIKNKRKTFDLLRGTEKYKNHFAKNQISNAIITLRKNNLIGRVRYNVLKYFIKYDNLKVRGVRDNFKYLLWKIQKRRYGFRKIK